MAGFTVLLDLFNCIMLSFRLANHEAKEDEEVTREQRVMARPVM